MEDSDRQLLALPRARLLIADEAEVARMLERMSVPVPMAYA